MNVPYLWVYILFASLTITSLILFGIASALRSAGFPDRQRRQIVRSAAALLFGWLALYLILGSLGIFQAGPDRKVPVIAFAILIPIIAGIWMIRSSSVMREVLRAVPQQWMVGVQAYRGLGSIFLILYGWRLLPGVFALPAGFGDTLVGVTALLVAALYVTGSPNRDWLVAAWNLLGIADLVIAVGTGFLSAPGPAQLFSFAAPNVLVGAYPLVMIPIYAVPLSIVVHAASLTRLAWAHETKRVSAKPASSVA
jgi:hypothetical protein